MEPTLFRFIWRHSKREQIMVLLLTLASFPFLYMTLELPKIIINDALSGEAGPHDLGFLSVSPVSYLMLLCAALFVLILISGFLKMRVNVYKGVLGERMLRRLRFQMMDRVLRFPMPQFQRTSQGEIVSMVASETEPLAGYIGDAIALPAFQGGTMLTILIFMFVQDPVLGLAATAMIPIQAAVIPRLQRQVNQLGKQRVLKVRRLSEEIGESVSGIRDIRINGTARYTLSGFSQRLGEIFGIRMSIYHKKFFMKGLNNFLGQMTPLSFYAIGGYQVIQGDLTIGALVAAVAAYKDLAAPWKELLNYYQRMADSNIKYDQLHEQFVPDELLEKQLQYCPGTEPFALDGVISLNNVSLASADGVPVFSNLSLTVEEGATIAITGTDTTARERFVEMLTRITPPTGGRILLGDQDIATIPETILGPNFGYVGPDSYIFNDTIFDNVFFGMKTTPDLAGDGGKPTLSSAQVKDDKEAGKLWMKEAEASGNSIDPYTADWVNYENIGALDQQDALNWWLQVIEVTGATETLFKLGLDTVIDPNEYAGMAAQILGARQYIRQRLTTRDQEHFVSPFDYQRYNTYASVAENILFGTPMDDRLATSQLAQNDYCHSVFKRFDLVEPIQEIGLKLAEMLVEMFEDLPPGHEFYEQYSFVDEEVLDRLPKILRQVQSKGRSSLSLDERNLLASLTFELRVERHRLGLIDEELQNRLVELRHYFHDNLPVELRDAVAMFDPHDYNPALSIRGNLLFGKVAFSLAGAKEKVEALIDEVLEDFGIKESVILLIRDLDAGVGGSKVPTLGRQRMALGRALVKRPKILIANAPLQAMAIDQRDVVRQRIRNLLPDTTIIWLDQDIVDDSDVDRRFEIRDGRLIETIDAQSDVAADMTKPTAYGNQTETADLALADDQSAEVRLLAQVPIFAHLQPQQLKLLAFTAERLQFEAGEAFYQPGDQPDGVYVVIDGMVDMIRGVRGEEMVVATLGPEGVIGELEVLSSISRVALIRAATKVSALRIDPMVFINFVRNDPELAFAVIRGIGLRSIGRADEWRQASKDLEDKAGAAE
ncbi:MAG: cyclic nucleotide-binding domain-containing protein [Alphaproteobacteria bacterium]|nr:cyclic nucleotide-binding domain-containing protein [Alphaproteobacteria bacterium SS10]